jgi:DNA replication protein DnaC
MITEPQSIATMSSLAVEFATRLGVERSLTPIDFDAVGATYAADCRRRDCFNRWQTACPVEYQDSDWQHPQLAAYRPQIERVLAWRPIAGGKGMLLTGPTGRGKTRSMWALVKALSEECKEVRVWHSTDFFAKLQEQVNFGRDDALGWVQAVARRKILVIDDLGQESVMAAKADWAQSWFFRLLDIRLGEELPIIITTNLTADAIACQGDTQSRKGLRADPLIRRLLDLCDIVKFEATSTTNV